ncbi:hypothetical protein MJO29_004769 [Puccinia striiformis f. sp. tritici]|nr:hypothetical protein MJO29_004769 [Puccinia striiformis f. sp. tritici]
MACVIAKDDRWEVERKVVPSCAILQSRSSASIEVDWARRPKKRKKVLPLRINRLCFFGQTPSSAVLLSPSSHSNQYIIYISIPKPFTLSAELGPNPPSQKPLGNQLEQSKFHSFGERSGWLFCWIDSTVCKSIERI